MFKTKFLSIIFFCSMFFCSMFLEGYSQKVLYSTNTGNIKFDANQSIIHAIHAENKFAKVIFRPYDGAIAAVLNINQFVFPNPLMQEHFNENYIDSEKYPKATFKGVIKGFVVGTFKERTYLVDGTFKIKGVEKEMSISIRVVRESDNGYSMTSDFLLAIDDFNIKVPSVMSYKIAEKVRVNLDAIVKK